jgi:septal ring factor EnvC (AmiA/AmiB activator)
LNLQLEQAEKQIGSLTNQLENGNMNTRKLEHQIESLERELSEKNEEVCFTKCFALFSTLEEKN